SGGRGPSLGEAQQGQARLRVAAVLTRALVGGLSAIKVADEAEKIALDGAGAGEGGRGDGCGEPGGRVGAGGGGGGGVGGCGEPVAGVSSLDESLRPRPEQPEDLGAVQEAVAP